MARIEKTVFISYRRTDVFTALAVYENLKNRGFDVFFDYTSVSSGDFEQIIIGNIKARAHFLILLTPTALDRCNEPGDWLRREIETAIDEKRNIVPLFFKGFQFGTPSVSEKLTGKLQTLSHYNGLNVHEDYFEAAMEKLCVQFLNIHLDTILHPVSTEVQKMVREEQVAADEAIKQREHEKEPEKPAEEASIISKVEQTPSPAIPPKSEIKEKPAPEKEQSKPVVSKPVGSGVARLRTIPWKPISLLAGGILLIALCCVWGGSSIWNNLFPNIPKPTRTSRPVETKISQLTESIPPLPTNTLIPPTPTLVVATQLVAPFPTNTLIPPTPAPVVVTEVVFVDLPRIGADGMPLHYVFEGEFTMGSDDGEEDEKPVHTVDLDGFWIDETEVTNEMYAMCVRDGNCNQPSDITYYEDTNYANHPVVFVSWYDAQEYCSWADRRLPTEAEWEKAARGRLEGKKYPWGDESPVCEQGAENGAQYGPTYSDCVGDMAHVKSFGKNGFGLYDMAGNVWEWVADWYDDSYYSNSPLLNPSGPDSGQKRVLRGGSWANDKYLMRSAYRNRSDPAVMDADFGFRCAMDAP